MAVKSDEQDDYKLDTLQMEDQVTQDPVQMNDSELDHQLGSQTSRGHRSWLLDGVSVFDKSNGKIGRDRCDTTIKFSKKNKFKTFPKSCLKERWTSHRFDRRGAKIDPTGAVEVDNESRNEYHISFRDQVKKKPLIKIIEVESFKKYNSEGKWGNHLWCTIF